MKKRKWLVTSFFLFLVLSFLIILESYGLFEVNTESPVVSDLAKWQIAINYSNITGENQTFLIPQVNWLANDKVSPGKAAPGSSGYFEIIIDPTGSEVAIEYEIELDFANLNNDKIYISSVLNKYGQPVTLNLEGNYIGVISLTNVLNTETDIIRVNFVWANDEYNNEIDSDFVGMENAFLDVPITIRLSQYTG